MPIYDYQCEDCGHEFEVIVLDATTKTFCSSCGSASLKRLLSRIAPEGRSAKFIQNARKVAAREGHFSNFVPSERLR